jgi:hypothetical protein
MCVCVCVCVCRGGEGGYIQGSDVVAIHKTVSVKNDNLKTDVSSLISSVDTSDDHKNH